MVEELLDRVRKHGCAGEVYFVESEEREVEFNSGLLKTAETKMKTGACLRVVNEGRLGYSTTTDPARIDDVVESALAASVFGKETGCAFPGPASLPSVESYDPAVAGWSQEDAVREGEKARALLKAACPKGRADISLGTSVARVRIANTSGLDCSFETTAFRHYIVVSIIEGDSILWIDEGGSYGDLTIKTDDYVAAIAERAALAGTGAPKISGRFPVLVTAQVLPNLLEAIRLGVNGKSLVKGDSPLIGREGDQVLGERVTLTDDPLLGFSPGAAPFDDEGSPSAPVTVFEKGVFRSFLFDLDTAADAGRTSTGSARRSALAPPSPGFSNIVLETGRESRDTMIRTMKEGVLVHGVIGGGQSNLLAGDFALNVMLGFYVRDGEIAGRLIDTMISGNVYEAFPDIASLGSEAQRVGTYYGPDVLFDTLPVSGA